MMRRYSARMQEDVSTQVLTALRSRGMVNVAGVAEDVRLRNLAENVAREDIEYLVMQTAELYGAAMEFDCMSLTETVNGRPLPGVTVSE